MMKTEEEEEQEDDDEDDDDDDDDDDNDDKGENTYMDRQIDALKADLHLPKTSGTARIKMAHVPKI